MRLLFSVCVILEILNSFSQASSVLRRDLASIIESDIESVASCTGCDTVLVLLKGLATFGDTAFVDTLTELCIISKADDPDVCSGAVSEEGPIVAADLRGFSVGSHTSQLFCITFLGLCSYPSVTSYTVSFPSPKPDTSRPAVSGQTPLQVVHFSDIHVDQFYEVGASYNCTKPICCRPYTSADSPGNNSYPAGPYGNHNCDAPVSLEESMYKAIQSIAPDAVFTLFTGDIVDHAVWETTENQNIIDINDAYSRMSGLPQVYGTAGNHESSPCNSFPPKDLSVSSDYQWVYNTLSQDWTHWIGTNSSAQVDNFGAYSVKYPNGNLRVISLNTNLYYIENFWLYQPTMETDPSGQFAWLVNELQAAEDAGERVYIIGHMPMGLSDAFRDGSNYYSQIITRYSATIAATFFGHTHVDQFEIAYSDYNAQNFSNALEVSYICPSMTPTSGSPAFRVYTVDPVTFGVLGVETYIANISSPTYQTEGPVWEKYYSAKEVYGGLVEPPISDPAAELTPAFWHNITAVFESDDAEFQSYYQRQSRGYSNSTCTGTCKTQQICGMRAAESQYNCATITPGINFKKRDEGAVTRAEGVIGMGECEGSMLRPIIAKIVAKNGVLEDGYERARQRYGGLSPAS